MLQFLAQAEILSWDRLTGVGGASALAIVVWLFLTDKIRTNRSAGTEIEFVKERCDREVATWKAIAKQESDRADRCEERMLASLEIAKKSVESTERVAGVMTTKGSP